MPERSYTTARQCFARLREAPQGAVAEYESAIRVLAERYNTTIYENRFIAGGAIELFTLLLLRSAGVSAQPCGDETASGDITLPGGSMLSIKANLTGKPRNERLINTMGDSVAAEWTTATVFVLSGKGLVYGDPSMADESDMRRAKDALLISAAAVKRFADTPDCLIPLDIASKPHTRMTYFSHKASNAVAKQILFELESRILLRHSSDSGSQDNV